MILFTLTLAQECNVCDDCGECDTGGRAVRANPRILHELNMIRVICLGKMGRAICGVIET